MHTNLVHFLVLHLWHMGLLSRSNYSPHHPLMRRIAQQCLTVNSPVRFAEKTSWNTVSADLLWERKHSSDQKHKPKSTDYKTNEQGQCVTNGYKLHNRSLYQIANHIKYYRRLHVDQLGIRLDGHMGNIIFNDVVLTHGNCSNTQLLLIDC